MRAGTYTFRNGKHRLLERLEDGKTWRVCNFNAENSDMSSLREYDEIEYDLTDNKGIKIYNFISVNKDVEKFFSGEPMRTSDC